MELLYCQKYQISAIHVDCFGRAKPSVLLYFAQEIAGEHCVQLGADWDTLNSRNLFWALMRTKVEISRLPALGETITLETWPMPETRTAYPRCTVGYDEKGAECFRIIGIWVLMDTQTRTMVLPGNSSVRIDGILRGAEPEVPRGLPAKPGENSVARTVGYAELDRNLHMNNTKYLDWVNDLLPMEFHRTHPIREFTICYLSEAREGQTVVLDYSLDENNVLSVDGHREKTNTPGEKERVFAAKLQF